MATRKIQRLNCLYEACNNKVGRNSTKYCSTSCLQKTLYKEYIERWKSGLESGNTNSVGSLSRYVRKYLITKANNRCTLCGWSEINIHSNKIPLTIDHIDGDWNNSKEENLVVLCYNCHSLTPTWCALNMGKGRRRAIKIKKAENKLKI